jgi:putative heme iron utilization protein
LHQLGGAEAEARVAIGALLRAQRDGVLATLSARRDGWPFGSLVQYALAPSGEPVFLLSGLAEHTRNLQMDARASLLVREQGAEDPLAAPRVTLLGRIERVEDDPTLRARYLEWHPRATQYLELADFAFYAMKVTEARYVGGFGEMGWIGWET